MKDQIVMSRKNGACCVAIPLYRRHEMDYFNLGYILSIAIEEIKPVAYIIDIGSAKQLMNAEFVESKLEFIGDL